MYKSGAMLCVTTVSVLLILSAVSATAQTPQAAGVPGAPYFDSCTTIGPRECRDYPFTLTVPITLSNLSAIVRELVIECEISDSANPPGTPFLNPQLSGTIPAAALTRTATGYSGSVTFVHRSTVWLQRADGTALPRPLRSWYKCRPRGCFPNINSAPVCEPFSASSSHVALKVTTDPLVSGTITWVP